MNADLYNIRGSSHPITVRVVSRKALSLLVLNQKLATNDNHLVIEHYDISKRKNFVQFVPYLLNGAWTQAGLQLEHRHAQNEVHSCSRVEVLGKAKVPGTQLVQKIQLRLCPLSLSTW